MRRLALVIICLCCCIVPAAARIINIPAEYATIQGGIDASLNGDTVLAQPGIYYDRLNLNNHNITLGSLYLTTGDESFIESTIIDGESLGTVVTFESGEDRTASITGFTIQNGYRRSGGGGGILCADSSPRIDHNIIRNNIASWGGGIDLLRSSSVVSNCLVYENQGSDGSGIETERSNVKIINCTFSRNLGAGISFYSGRLAIKNTISWGNRGNGLHFYGPSDSVQISYSLFNEVHLGDGNLATSPLFIDPANNNFNVCSMSPSIDAGDPGILDPDSSRSDIGFYYPTHISCPNGDTWVVANDGSDSTGNGTLQNPFRTIQHAIDIALQGDTVFVLQGIYYEKLNISFESLALVSNWIYSRDTLDIYGTVIDAERHGSVIYLEDCDSNSAIIGFTIQNGLNDGGGGIRCQTSSTKIEYNRINNNKARYLGGGIYLSGSRSLITNNFIAYDSVYEGNWARGGGIFIADSQPVIRNNIIYRNWTSGFGGGIQMDHFGEGIITNNVIAQNRTNGNGGGIACDGANSIINYNVIYGNRAENHAGAVYTNSCTPVLLSDIIWGNFGNGGNEQFYGDFSSIVVSYCDVQGGWTGQGNIDINPKIRSLTNIDYRLQSTFCGNSYNSPCIDAGPPDSIDAELSCYAGLGSSRSDIGAYGGGGNMTSIEDEQFPVLPSEIILSQNYPNPFNPNTTIHYDLARTAVVQIDIFDILGRKIETLADTEQPPGSHSVVWNGKDRPSGIYFYRLKAGDYSETRKMLLVK